MWLAIDVKKQEQYWIDRLDLSNAILSYGEVLRTPNQ